jgi:hypothetical protein
MTRSTILRYAAGLALVLGALASSAQSDPNLAVRVPFDFMVGTTMFPAGEYAVKPAGPQTYLLAARNGYEYVVMKTRPVLMKSNFGAGGLMFVNDGHHYRLHEVRMGAIGGQRLAPLPFAGKPVWVAASNLPGNRPRLITIRKDH